MDNLSFDLDQTPSKEQNIIPVFSVTEISQALKTTVETKYGFIRVKGEISGLKLHSSGHLYFSLKDSESVLDAICWRGTLAKTPLKPADGMEVICQGRLTTYGARSKYQMIIEHLEHSGVGALLKLLQERKEKLACEGLFDSSRKKPLPFLPRTIGVITSQTGAVIRDILHRLQDRFPRHVILWSVPVQGESAAQAISQAIKGFNEMPAHLPTPDVIIVARGGGSLEDLWAFNEEIVVRAVAASCIPIISAVGHETDFTLIDYVSDCRAPTPTAAAEMAVPLRLDLFERVHLQEHRLTASVQKLIQSFYWKLQSQSRGLISPRSILENKMQLLDDRFDRLKNAAIVAVHNAQQKFGFLSERLRRIHEQNLVLGLKIQRLDKSTTLLESYSYNRTLERGFVLVKQGTKLISSAKNVLNQEAILKFHDGDVKVTIHS